MSPLLTIPAASLQFFVKKFFSTVLTITLFFLVALQAKTQTNYHPAEEVAKAEKGFAKRALQTNTRQAFLEYYDDSVVVFRSGKAVKGKDASWGKRKVDSTELWWQPVFADISASGDFGYTTGPWEWRRLKTDNMASAYGYYNSIWKKGKDGIWKVVIDIGVPNQVASPEKNKITSFSGIQSKGVIKNYQLLKKELLDVEIFFFGGLYEKQP
jgi:ketosteroid isomerase-like protein